MLTIQKQGWRSNFEMIQSYIGGEEVAEKLSVSRTSVWKAENSLRKEGYVIISNAQTEGIGRAGRKFYSPEDTGIYMSLLLRPKGISPSQTVKITTMAAVAVCETIEAVSKEPAEISIHL